MSRDILTLPPPPFDHRIPYGPGEHHFGHLRLPPGRGPHPVAIVIHGGFWRAAYDLAYAGHLSAALAKAGFATWNIEYRRIGQDGGGYPGTFDDVRAAAAHVKTLAGRFPLDLRRTLAVGHSAGGHLALWLATQSEVKLRGVIGIAAVSDLRMAHDRKLSSTVVADLLGGSPQTIPQRYQAASPIESLPLRAHAILVHGRKDDIVPLEMSERFAQKSGARLVVIDDAGHFEPVDPRSPAWQKVELAARSLIQP